MTFVVPFDGSDLAESALVRATEFATVFDDSVLAVTVVPKGNVDYASERGWVNPDGTFDEGRVPLRDGRPVRTERNDFESRAPDDTGSGCIDGVHRQ